MSLLHRRNTNYHPPVARLQNDLNVLFDSLFAGTPNAWPSAAEGQAARFAPSVSVSDTKEAVLVRAEVPGLDATEIEVHVEDDVLVLKGEKKAEKHEEHENHHYSELSYGSFVRRIGLPCRVDSESAQATVDKGVLKLKLPKISVSGTRQIKVK